MRFIFAVLTLALGAAASPATRNIGTPIPNQYIVVFKKDTPDASVATHENWISTVAPVGSENWLSSVRATPVGSAKCITNRTFEPFPSIPGFDGFEIMNKYWFGDFRGYAVKVSAEIAEKLKTLPEVDYVQPDTVVRILGAGATSDNSPWGIRRLAKPSLPLPIRYTANAAGGANVRVYILDSGINTAHPEFGGRAIFPGGTFTTTDKTFTDMNGHGTHVAGTIGSTTYGVAKKATLVAVKVFESDGTGELSNLIAAVNWVALNAVYWRSVFKINSVANLAVAGGASGAFDDAVAAAVNSGLTFVVGAGNERQNACNISPSRTPSAITVAASDVSDRFASFSNFGSCVDIIAPGVGINSTWNDNSTRILDGTSMATAHVTGIVAVMLSAGLATTPAEVAAYLNRTAVSGRISGVGATTVNLLAQVPQ
ncbi:hypothetical protein HDU96_000930 [Phlyctochytrium bullatum]|nr:hypothetical protein HDU96_000930 [Phlyctochytrium bullatum]